METPLGGWVRDGGWVCALITLPATGADMEVPGATSEACSWGARHSDGRDTAGPQAFLGASWAPKWGLRGDKEPTSHIFGFPHPCPPPHVMAQLE